MMQTPQSLIFRSGIIAVLATFVYLMIPLPDPVFKDDYSTAILDENGELLRVFLNSEEQWCFPDDAQLKRSAKLETAVLEYEDVHFYRHPGINPLRVLMAIWQNATSDQIVSGASTITMQVARMSGRRPRTYSSKLIEILVALKLEFRYSKNEILRLYLNHAPYGGNIIGFQAAALRYFSKIPQQLTWSEAALLAVLPNAPGLMSPDVNPGQLRNKRDRLLQKLNAEGHIDDESLELALIEPLPEGSIPFKTLAAHAARRLKFQHAPDGGILQSTLNRNIQHMAEEETQYHQNDLMRQGIMNSAAIIVDTRTGAIRAYVGSQDFFDLENKGQVDGVIAPRSSASTLKPLLYGAAIDDGIIMPTTQLRDVPSYYGSFSPSNADEQFDGVVIAEEALVRSLNVPAVRLLYTYGVHPFYLMLKSAGISTLFRQAQEYGLPLILGGAEVNLLELAGMFRSFSDGTYQTEYAKVDT
ncbi:MAG: penicillin-binding protein 1C, partial [Calditrichota bacterium]